MSCTLAQIFCFLYANDIALLLASCCGLQKWLTSVPIMVRCGTCLSVSVQCRDAADDHLSTELVHLDNLKKMLESHLALVKEQLQTLYRAHERLTAVHKERECVIDLMCYAVSCVGEYSSSSSSSSTHERLMAVFNK